VKSFDVFSTVHHSIGLFFQPNLMHNSITTCICIFDCMHLSQNVMILFRVVSLCLLCLRHNGWKSIPQLSSFTICTDMTYVIDF